MPGVLEAKKQEIRSRVFLIAGTRGLLSDQPWPQPTGDPHWVGRHGEHLVRLLTVLWRPENEALRSEIGETMTKFGMRDPWAGLKEGERLGASYKDPELGTVLDAPYASAGARQALTVVTQVVWSKPGSLVMIEEPEISLHPEGQVEMCRFLAKHAAQGKQVIATTHSQFMLLALQKPVREGLISSEDIAIYHIERNRDPSKGDIGATIAERLPLAPEGYLEEWVSSFSHVEKELVKEWATIIADKERQKK